MSFPSSLFLLPVATALLATGALAAPTADAIPYRLDQRPAILVSKSEAGPIVLGNVRFGFADPQDPGHSAKWRQVSVDPAGVQDVVAVIKPFKPEWMAAHVFLCVRFSADKPIRTTLGETSQGLVFSVEARLRAGQHYDLIRGAAGQFHIVYQLCSWEDYLQRASLDNQRLLPYVLSLPPEQSRQMLLNAIELSLKDRSSELYNTLTDNCTTSLFDIVNTVLPPKQRFPQYLPGGVVKNLFTSLPRWIDVQLRLHHLMKEKLPQILPSAANRQDLATKQKSGAELDQARDELAKVRAAIAANSAAVAAAIDSGQLDATRLEMLFYDVSSQSVPWFAVPGVTPDERDNGRFDVGPQFDADLRSAGPSGLRACYEKYAAAYSRAVEQRLLLEGPDEAAFLLQRERALAGQLRAMVSQPTN